MIQKTKNQPALRHPQPIRNSTDYMFIANSKIHYFKKFSYAVESAKNISYRVYKNEICVIEVVTNNQVKHFRNVAYIRARGTSRFHDANLWRELKSYERSRSNSSSK